MSRRLLLHVITIAIVCLGALARLAPLGLQRFHEDEALYSSWGLQIASGEDMWLTGIPVDKPPLFFYLQAGAFAIFGPSETAARLPSLLASVASIGLLYLLAEQLYGQPTASTAAALLAASPFAISFAPTAFLDALMGMWVLASCVAAANGRWGWAGVLLGLAGATKWQGVAFLPLLVGIAFCTHSPTLRKPLPVEEAAPQGGLPTTGGDDLDMPPRGDTIAPPSSHSWQGEQVCPSHRHWLACAFFNSERGRNVLRAAAGLLAISTLVWGWDLARPQPSILWQLRANYGELGLAHPGMWGVRVSGWANLLRYVFYHPCLNALFLAGLPMLMLSDVRKLAQLPERKRTALHLDLLLVAFAILFLAVLTLVRIPVWDRYLLALVPLGCLLLARVLWLPRRLLIPNHRLRTRRKGPRFALSSRARQASFLLSILVTAFLLLTLPLLLRDAAVGRFPIGGDQGTYQGIEQVVAYFRGHVLGGTILYHHWLGNHYRYYMHHFPYTFRWWQTPDELAQDAVAASDVERWIVFPSWQDERAARKALTTRGLRLIRRHETYRPDGSLSFTIYQIEGP